MFRIPFINCPLLKGNGNHIGGAAAPVNVLFFMMSLLLHLFILPLQPFLVLLFLFLLLLLLLMQVPVPFVLLMSLAFMLSMLLLSMYTVAVTVAVDV